MCAALVMILVAGERERLHVAMYQIELSGLNDRMDQSRTQAATNVRDKYRTIWP